MCVGEDKIAMSISDRTKRYAVTRRQFNKQALSVAAAGSAALAGCPNTSSYDNASCVPLPVLPPKDATVQTTACAFCVVGCGYKVYTWPEGNNQDEDVHSDFSPDKLLKNWVSPQMHNNVIINNKRHHVIVRPDPDAKVVNPGGAHHLGGSLGQYLYSPETDDGSRFLYPQIRIEDKLYQITWDEAIELLARMSRHTKETYGKLAWGIKSYSYQFYENTYAITKLVFGGMETPCWAPHDKCAQGSDVPGLTDAGILPFSASYQDWADADVIFLSGVALWETKGVLFDEWVARGRAQLIVVNPLRDQTADYALETGGLFLQINPGTDALLHNSIAWVILKNGWEDKEFIERATVNDREAYDWEVHGLLWRRHRYALRYDDYRSFILDDKHDPQNAAETIGVEAQQIYDTASLMTRLADGNRLKTSLMLEKGNYWGHNYPNTASFASLGLLVGSGDRPGRVMSRGGGHQRGMISARPWPKGASQHTFEGWPLGMNLDQWAMDGHLRFAWVIGCTWGGGGSAAAGPLYDSLRRQARETGPQLTSVEAFPGGDKKLDVEKVEAVLRAKLAAGGLMLVQQDKYHQSLTEIADLVLPAAGWGESTFTRMQGERRLRLYSQIIDPPGECRPDWWIISQVAQRLGFAGFNWPDGNAIFEEAATYSRDENDYSALVELATKKGIPAYDLLRARGTEGYQCPLKLDADTIVETKRFHDVETNRPFKTLSGKALFVRGDFDEAQERQELLKPRAEYNELWIINRRHSSTWNSLVEDARNPYRAAQLSENFIDIHPDDARDRGIVDGKMVEIVTRNVVEKEGVVAGNTHGHFLARVHFTDRVKPGVACTHFNFRGNPRFAANNTIHASTEPITNKHAFKLGRGEIRPLGR